MNKPKLLIIAGPNGSGKTSITGKILKITKKVQFGSNNYKI